MNIALTIGCIIAVLIIAALLWQRYIQSLEHGELKAKYSKLVQVTKNLPRPKPCDTLSHILSAAVPVPTEENKGRPFVTYTILTNHQAQKVGVPTDKAKHVTCHQCHKPSIISSFFPLHGMGHCPHCSCTMTF